jgi:hypothetical protein
MVADFIASVVCLPERSGRTDFSCLDAGNWSALVGLTVVAFIVLTERFGARIYPPGGAA